MFGLLLAGNVSATGVTVPGTTPAAKSSCLSSRAESTLLSFFSLQDTLSKEDAVVLAQEVGRFHPQKLLAEQSTLSLRPLATVPREQTLL